MGRQIRSWYCERTAGYLARLGEVSPKTGKRKAVILRDEYDRKIRKGDEAGRLAALARLAGTISEEERRQYGPTVADVCAAFVAWHKETGSAERTYRDHDYHLRRFASFTARGRRYADRPAAEIGPDDLWALQDAGLGSIRLLFSSVLACWRWAARPVRGREPSRLIPSYPFQGLERPRTGQKIEKLIPWRTTRQLIRFARARARNLPTKFRRERTRVAERLRVLCLELIAETGCRPFEAVRVRWDEILWNDHMIAVSAARDKSRRRGRAPGKARRISMSRRFMDRLRRIEGWPQHHPEWVFLPGWTRAKAGPSVKEFIRWWREELKPAAIAVGIPVPAEATLYWLRHEWQTTGLEVDSAEGVSAAAGNSPGVVLSSYEHTRNRRIREVAEKVRRRRRETLHENGGAEDSRRG